jgi:hypothetical protein
MGRLGADQITGGDAIEIGEYLAAHKGASASDLIDKLLALLVTTADGDRLTPEKIGELSLAEKEDFAEKLLVAEDHLYRMQVMEKTKGDDGKVSVSFKMGDVVLPRGLNETAIDYFKRAYTHNEDEQAKKFAAAMGPRLDLDNAIKNLTGWAKPSALDALAKNFAISDSLSKRLAGWYGVGNEFSKIAPSFRDPLRDLPQLNVPGFGLTNRFTDGQDEPGSGDIEASRTMSESLIRNLRDPAVDTNEKLDVLIERFDHFEVIAGQTVELVQSMNAAATGLLTSFSEGAKSTERFARRSIWIAGMALAVGIFVPLIQAGYDNRKSHQQDGEAKALVTEIVRQVTGSEQQASTGIRETIANQANRVHADQAELAKAIAAVGDALRGLNERRSAPTGSENPAKP